MKLFRTTSAALPSSDGIQRSPEISRDSGAERQFSDEILRSISGILRLLESLLQITDMNELNDLPNSIKMDLSNLRQSLLNARPQNISLGRWESVFSDSLVEDNSGLSNNEWEKLDEVGKGACYSFHPEILAFQNGVKASQYGRQFTDMNAFTIVAVKEFKADLDAIIKKNLHLALFLRDVIDTLVYHIMPLVLDRDEDKKIKEGLTTPLYKLDCWWENSKLNSLKEHLYDRGIINELDFIRDVITKGLLTKLPMSLITLLEQSIHRLAPIIQLHPANSCLEIHSIYHNICCIYTTIKTVVNELNALVNGLDFKKTPVAKNGLNYICDNIMVRNNARSQHKTRARDIIVQTRNRAKSADLGQGVVLLPDNNSRLRKSGANPTYPVDRKLDEGGSSRLGVDVRQKISPRTQLMSKSSSGTPEPKKTPTLSKRRSNSASSQSKVEGIPVTALNHPTEQPQGAVSRSSQILKNPLSRSSFNLDLRSITQAANVYDKSPRRDHNGSALSNPDAESAHDKSGVSP